MNGLPDVEHPFGFQRRPVVHLCHVRLAKTEIFRARQMVSERLSALDTSLPVGSRRTCPASSIMGEIMQIAIPVDPAWPSPMGAREYADCAAPTPMAIPRWRR